MNNLDFRITKIKKYVGICSFYEGLAAVRNEQGLCGFIDKEGMEEIPSQKNANTKLVLYKGLYYCYINKEEKEQENHTKKINKVYR